MKYFFINPDTEGDMWLNIRIHQREESVQDGRRIIMARKREGKERRPPDTYRRKGKEGWKDAGVERM